MAVDHTWIWLDKNGALQQTFVEQGEISEYELENLTPSTGYRVTAGCVENGLQSTSNTMQFTTIAAGTITLTHSQTVRSGNNYIVTYTYTSTYAPSWTTLSTNGSTFQGVINSGQHTVTYTVTGLTAGEAYLTNVTLGDIYGETATVTGSIYATVVNSINIAYSGATETTVTMSLDYIVDSGFHAGFLEYWGVADDPSTDQPQGHTQFNDGDTTATITNLTAGTEYKFRATIELNDSGHSEIVSNVVTASTAAIDYLRITNETSSSNDVVIKYQGLDTSSRRTVEFSTDEGITWTSRTLSGSGSVATLLTVTLRTYGKSVIFRGDFSWNSTTGNNYIYFKPTEKYSVSGNLFTLTRRSVIEAGNKASITSSGRNEFNSLFSDSDKLIDSSNLSINNISSVGVNSFLQFFKGCSLLKFTPDFSSVESVDEKGLWHAFTQCSGLKTTPNFSRVRTIGNNGFEYAFAGCGSLETAYAPNISTWDTSIFLNWLSGVAASGTLYVPTQALADQIPDDDKSGCPSGWEKVVL